MNNEFSVNQIVKGVVCGTFVILGFRNDLGPETYAQLKVVDPTTGRAAGGELALPLTALKAA